MEAQMPATARSEALREARETAPEVRLDGLPEQQRLMLAARAGRLGIWDYDIASDTITCDAQWLQIMGLPPHRARQSLQEFRAIIHPEDVERATEVPKTARKLLAAAEDYSIEFRIIRPDGEVRWVRSMASIIEDERHEPAQVVGFVTDITAAREAEERLARLNALLERQNEELARQALVDPLTGIANRRRFDQELGRACAQATRLQRPLALAMIDVDHFKAYNDHLGHAQGDRALQAVAEVIAGAAWRPYDLAARYGGEEFVLILSEACDPLEVLDRIRDDLMALRIPHPASPVAPFLTVSCGCAVATDGADPEALMARSDEALYRAKLAGRHRTVMAGVEGRAAVAKSLGQ
jgi:diguanylate cyclase (GGDEF)-like protein/PAS domain S-box-containing protein